MHKSVYTNRGHNWSDTLDERKYICSVMHTKAQHADTGVRANKYLHACVDMPTHSAHKDKTTDYYTVFKVSRMGIMGGGATGHLHFVWFNNIYIYIYNTNSSLTISLRVPC